MKWSVEKIAVAIGAFLLFLYWRSTRFPGEIQKYYVPATIVSLETGVPVALIMAVIWQESRGNPLAKGSSGEQGLMQVSQIAIDDLRQNGYDVYPKQTYSVFKNIRQGASFLKLMMKQTINEFQALRAYNAGLSGAKSNPVLGNEYAKSVLNFYNEWR